MRHFWQPDLTGGTWFFTLALAERGASHLVSEIDSLRAAYAETLMVHPFRTEAIVVLPDHMHLIWTFETGDADPCKRIYFFRKRFAELTGLAGPSETRTRACDTGLWERAYHERQLETRAQFEAHVDYVRSDPVRHGYTARASDWAHSSIHRDIARHLVGPNWGCSSLSGDYGETQPVYPAPIFNAA